MEKLEIKNNHVFEIIILIVIISDIYVYFVSKYFFKNILAFFITVILLIIGIYGVSNKKSKILSIISLIICLLIVLFAIVPSLLLGLFLIIPH